MKAIAEFGEEPAWIANAIAGEQQPAMHEYLMMSSLVSLPVTVLSGLVDADRSSGVALRAGTLASPTQVSADAQKRGVELIEARRLIGSWYASDSAYRTSALEKLRQVISHDKFAPIAGRNTAQQVRAMLGKLGIIDAAGPIGDLVSVVESLGVPVELSTDMPDGLHGVTVHDEALGSWDAAIVLRVADYWTRQRYTLAHELCHVLYRDSGLVSINNEETATSGTDVERRAESFARHFLMPTGSASRVWRYHSTRSDHRKSLCELMMHFGVSRDAALIFLSAEGLISQTSVEGLRRDLVKDQMRETGLGSAWEQLIAGQHDPSASVWLLESALKLYRQRLVPASLVASVLGQSESSILGDLERQGWSPGENPNF
ncbi:ImmA/IrrE family metallo-endopeptidase [Dactylosporangium sp. NPDC006015]|uniref:ImmA/IrrE family metallo-endopeptidase n=1 Tax=Dactylosporangium sp. NPDC006015 TaxID=3154576 RepID=UPI0033A685EB